MGCIFDKEECYCQCGKECKCCKCENCECGDKCICCKCNECPEGQNKCQKCDDLMCQKNFIEYYGICEKCRV